MAVQVTDTSTENLWVTGSNPVPIAKWLFNLNGKSAGLKSQTSKVDAWGSHKTNKWFSFFENSNKSWFYIKKELDKCDLLCANCHSIEHNKYDDENFLQYAEAYNLK